MRFPLRALTVVAALVVPAATTSRALPAGGGPTTSYSRLYVFGDSYSDIGAGYVDGNGPTAVAYLAWRMGLKVTHNRASFTPDESLVFAVSGARTGEGAGQKIKTSLLGYGMLNQGRDFAAAVASGRIVFDAETTLFFIAGGLNDSSLPTETTLANLRTLTGILRAAGGRHVTVALLPTKIPQFAAVGARLDPALERFARNEGPSLRVDLWLNHWGADFDAVMDHPDRYGLLDTTTACAGRAIFDQDPTPIGDPATFFFYHDGHPSTAVHRIVGGMLFDEIRAHPPAR